MLNEPTREKLVGLRLGVMAEAWAQQQRDPRITELSFDERLGMLVDAEHDARHSRRLARLLKDAELRIATACLEERVSYNACKLERANIVGVLWAVGSIGGVVEGMGSGSVVP